MIPEKHPLRFTLWCRKAASVSPDRLTQRDMEENIPNTVPSDDVQHTTSKLEMAKMVYCKMLIIDHLRKISVFTVPLVSEELTHSIEALLSIVEMSADVTYNEPLNSILEHLVETLKAVDWNSLGTVDVFKHMEKGELWLEASGSGRLVRVPMHEVYLASKQKIRDTKNPMDSMYLMFCMDVAFVNFSRICKMVLECQCPHLVEELTASIVAVERVNNLPYCTANLQMSAGSRRVTMKMADLMYKMSSNIAGNATGETLPDMEEEHLDVLESMLNSLAPQLQNVFDTVSEQLDTVEPSSMQDTVIKTVSECMSKNMGPCFQAGTPGKVRKMDDGQMEEN